MEPLLFAHTFFAHMAKNNELEASRFALAWAMSTLLVIEIAAGRVVIEHRPGCNCGSV